MWAVGSCSGSVKIVGNMPGDIILILTYNKRGYEEQVILLASALVLYFEV